MAAIVFNLICTMTMITSFADNYKERYTNEADLEFISGFYDATRDENTAVLMPGHYACDYNDTAYMDISMYTDEAENPKEIGVISMTDAYGEHIETTLIELLPGYYRLGDSDMYIIGYLKDGKYCIDYCSAYRYYDAFSLEYLFNAG